MKRKKKVKRYNCSFLEKNDKTKKQNQNVSLHYQEVTKPEEEHKRRQEEYEQSQVEQRIKTFAQFQERQKLLRSQLIEHNNLEIKKQIMKNQQGHRLAELRLMRGERSTKKIRAGFYPGRQSTPEDMI